MRSINISNTNTNSTYNNTSKDKNSVNTVNNNNITNIVEDNNEDCNNRIISATKSQNNCNNNGETDALGVLSDTANISLLVAAEIAKIGTGNGTGTRSAAGTGMGTDSERVNEMERDHLQTFKMLLL